VVYSLCSGEPQTRPRRSDALLELLDEELEQLDDERLVVVFAGAVADSSKSSKKIAAAAKAASAAAAAAERRAHDCIARSDGTVAAAAAAAAGAFLDFLFDSATASSAETEFDDDVEWRRALRFLAARLLSSLLSIDETIESSQKWTGTSSVSCLFPRIVSTYSESCSRFAANSCLAAALELDEVGHKLVVLVKRLANHRQARGEHAMQRLHARRVVD